MDIEQLRAYCLTKKGVTESFPFDQNTLVFKVMGKMFALANVDDFVSVNLKCEPEKAVELRELYEEVSPGYHMNKQHWNTVRVNEGVGDKLVYNWVDDSYDLIVQGLPKKLRDEMDSI
ncbi:MAG: MmcQ/YjbR family DNA-binding protein [Cyclobacteriaceae bacterium]|nr:MmcQ/YjbR family DNA-binding protein [Cyclobacteriaceae bacterium HetDA_MAG_MS6]